VAAERVGFLGAGAMGEALAGGLLAAGTPATALIAADPDPARRKLVAERLAIRTTAEPGEAVAESDLVVIAVKPSLVGAALDALGGAGEAALLRPLWVSIAAGVPLRSLESHLPAGARIVRAMPNTPALVRAGATAFAANAAASGTDRSAARRLFEAVGYAWEASHEAQLDAVTGLSGSGPAYVFVFLEALADAGVAAGLPRDAAYQLAFHTVHGSAKLALETGRHPGSLKDQVTSPGGTTIAGLERLEACGFRAAIYAAVEAATRRARELGGA
jgi:pyrroline-5-carboxylate reductase